ncbi:MAG TPA: LuxR C-terminal-related transcriptional regulator [Candidatus Limnocylindrales bacterium]|nr:LuxR C-terminal-related transcriptional regulator [Candidatus Limnocylindrales bacterium]
MTVPLLETKFHVPAPLPGRVDRLRLSEQLIKGAQGTLTLVSAPAGFGKSTLLAELATNAGTRPVAWLSLDAADNDPATFWAHAVAAIDRARPGAGAAARSILDASPTAIDAALAALVNTLATLDDALVVVLDDVHVIESPAIHGQLAWLLEHLPASAHLVMGTRSDPPIPLARLRARGALAEIRAADLRFSGDEAARFFGETMGLALTEPDVAALEARTEGWIAALQLAALSIRGRADAHAFIEAFAGDDRHVVDYLVEEVLRRQSSATREFLLATSVLDRLSGPLADALTGRTDGRSTLEGLDRANLFLVALDDQRRWYRYHHLFGGVLRAYLAAEQPEQIPVLHERAARWFQQQGDVEQAIPHAFDAGAFALAAELLELIVPTMRQLRREEALRRWIARIPRTLLDRRPVLLVEYAGTLLSLGEVDHVEELLDRAEHVDGPIVVVDQDVYEHLPAFIALYRAAVARFQDDREEHLARARRVLEVATEDDHLNRGGAYAFLGLAHWESGELDLAEHWYGKGMANLAKIGWTSDTVGGAITTAEIRLAQGRLTDALHLFEEGLAVATRGGEPFLRGAADMQAGVAEVRFQRNDLRGADEALRHSLRLGEAMGFPRFPHRVRVLEARMLQARGDIDGAVALLDEAERRYVPDFQPNLRPIAAQRAAIQLAHGRLVEARRWAAEAGVTTDEPVTFLREHELLGLTRLLVVDAPAKALPLARRLLAAAAAGGRNGSVLEILAVTALAQQAAGDVAAAAASMDRAVAIAEPEGYVRVFLDEGPAMVALLRVVTKRRGAAPYLAGLLRAATGSRDVPRPSTGLVEPLSERELEVLRLLRSELSGPEMASELVVSLNTLRTHTKNIYAKLGVTSRLAALRRAEELHLL